MKASLWMLCSLVSLMAQPAWAAGDKPYAGQQQREIKSLSTREIAGYRQGKGMGFAKAAELNHYPGPRHVLDLAEQLALSERQRSDSQALFDAMQAEAMALGERLIEEEYRLDQLFASDRVNEHNLIEATRKIAALRGELRYTHLKTHLAQRALLSPHQLQRYDQLRGYGEAGAEHQHQGH